MVERDAHAFYSPRRGSSQEHTFYSETVLLSYPEIWRDMHFLKEQFSKIEFQHQDYYNQNK